MELHKQQQAFFSTQKTRNLSFRRDALKRLRNAIIEQEDAIADAIYADFKKPRFETFVAETQFVLAEINTMLKNLEFWAQSERVSGNLANFPSRNYIYREPLGQVLIIAPWNYPFQLTLTPMVGAIAAGNTVVAKPSELTPNTAAIVEKIIGKVFVAEHVAVVQGGVETSQELLSKRWDHIFFTGSPRIGKIIYESAAKHLTPVTLELGGKNPCIVDETANISLAAKRIIWGKALNLGQTCLAPDYLLVHHTVKDKLVQKLKDKIVEAYGEKQSQSADLARIINERHYNRLKSLLDDQRILYGGETVDEDNFIGLTLVDEPDLNNPLMQGEIFGPILPIFSYEKEPDIDAIVKRYEKPLAAYIFSNKRDSQKKFIAQHGFGGGVINDTVIHIANKNLPFGGVGHSGVGAYHGKTSFDVFSHKKAIVKRGRWIDPPLRYAPYKLPEKIAKWVKHLF
ncbi:aldehyde dehydrogenase [Flagellimonas sp. S3867]|uniref:aldehyde dehydrogenase n=1 Tax=Flagellimonas sp. S3867 TaxID=2768063 RepID=UPI0016865355|nr:aldehyde dehydrogenase [Flagellimonas sp. S3867]